MAGSVNKVILVGNLGKDPKVASSIPATRSSVSPSPHPTPGRTRTLVSARRGRSGTTSWCSTKISARSSSNMERRARGYTSRPVPEAKIQGSVRRRTLYHRNRIAAFPRRVDFARLPQWPVRAATVLAAARSAPLASAAARPSSGARALAPLAAGRGPGRLGYRRRYPVPEDGGLSAAARHARRLEPGIQAAPSMIIRGRRPWMHGSRFYGGGRGVCYPAVAKNPHGKERADE